jgi:hypothetical protein
MTPDNLPQTNRGRAKLAIARQVAIKDGYVWRFAPNADQLRKQLEYLTLAERCLASVECLQTSYSWNTKPGRAK